jgi:NADH:ubiquinone oxidoreductase subunit K
VIPLVSLTSYIIISAAMLGIGLYGLSVKKNAMRILFAIEIIVNAANLNFAAFTRYMTPPQVSGQVIVFYSIAAAAMEAAVGLALILVAFRLNSTIDVRRLNKLKG